MKPTAILLLHCPDQQGIISEVTKFITDNKGNIVDLDQYVDHQDGIFFMRVQWELDSFLIPREKIKEYIENNAFNPSNMQTVSETVTINQASIPTAESISSREKRFTTGDQVYDYIQERVPDAPTTDGSYVLKVTVASGVPTYSWVNE
jgi:formyltetrahydrofolate hydrolase